MIDQGHIIFQEEKDNLLDNYRIVKGDTKNLNSETQKLFKNISSTAFGFIGITTRIDDVKKYIPDIMIERPTIEDIMLANIEGGKNNAISSGKKRFSDCKKYVLLMLIVCILIPPFMLWRVPDFAGPMSFCLSVIFSIFMLLQYVSQKENQYPKASALLCASPYPRKLLVLSKYVFCLTIYAVCCIIFHRNIGFPKLGAL